MGKSLSYISSEATQETNTVNVLTPILSFQPDDGLMWTLKNRVPRGKSAGFPIIANLDSAAATDLTTPTTLVLTVQRPEDDRAQPIAVAEENIAAWNANTPADQRDEDVIDSVKVELLSDSVNIRYTDTLYVEVEATAQIDWSESELYFLREAVQETPID